MVAALIIVRESSFRFIVHLRVGNCAPAYAQSWACVPHDESNPVLTFLQG